MKNRDKQRAHRKNGVSKEARLMVEAKEEQIDLADYCGIKDPTPYEAVKNIIRKESGMASAGRCAHV